GNSGWRYGSTARSSGQTSCASRSCPRSRSWRSSTCERSKRGYRLMGLSKGRLGRRRYSPGDGNPLARFERDRAASCTTPDSAVSPALSHVDAGASLLLEQTAAQAIIAARNLVQG